MNSSILALFVLLTGGVSFGGNAGEEPSKSSTAQRSPAQQLLPRKTYSLWVGANGGLNTIVNDPDLQKPATGVGISLAGGGSINANSLGLRAGLGWSHSSIGVSPSLLYVEETINNQGLVPDGLDTSFFYLEAAVSYFLNPRLQMGVNLLLPFGTDTQFTIRQDDVDSLPHPLGGVELKYSFGRSAFEQASWWYGVKVQKDLTLSHRDLYAALASLDFDFPVYQTIERPTIVYQNRYKYREKIVTTIKDRHFISLGIVAFEANQSAILAGDYAYLNAVGDYLVSHPQLWQGLLLGSNNFNFDKGAQEITRQRLQAIKELFAARGIKAEQVSTYELVTQEKRASLFDAFEAIDISIVGEKNVETLQKDIVHLMQQFAIPDTCSEGKCI